MAKTQLSFDQIKGNVVSVKDYGAVGDGVTDDTLAVDLAFSAGDTVDMGGYTYKYVASTHVGSAQIMPKNIIGAGFTLQCEGAVQFDMPDDFNWSGGKITSNDVFTIDPTIDRSVAADSVMLISNAASGSTRAISKGKCTLDFEYSAASDGSTRGEGFLRIAGTSAIDLEIDSKMVGAVLPFWINPESGSVRGSLRFENYDTGVLGKSGPSYNLDVVAINTSAQQLKWRATSTPSTLNGKDAVLIEASSTQSPEFNMNVTSQYAVERGMYVQHVANGVIRCNAIGSDAGKCTDGSQNLEVHAHAIFPLAQTSTVSRYAWQCYGGTNGATENITIYPHLDNRTGVSGNKESCSLLGELNNIVVKNAYGYDCGNGIWLVQGNTFGSGSVFEPKIDGVTFINARAEGPSGETPGNGAFTVFFGSKAAAEYVNNVVLQDCTSMPATGGVGTFELSSDVGGIADIINCSVDGVSDLKQYNVAVVNNATNGRILSWEQNTESKNYSYVYPTAIVVGDLAINTTTNTVFATVPSPPGNAATVEIEIMARHNNQAASNYINYKSVLEIGSTDTGANSVNIPIVNETASGQTITVTYNSTNGQITLNHTSTSALGFDSTTFYARVRSTIALTV